MSNKKTHMALPAINNSTKKASKFSLIIEFLVLIIIIGVFIFLMFKYAPTQDTKENPRFVDIDLDELKREASLIEPLSIGNQPAQNIFVLNYHVVSKEMPEDSYEISYEQFKANMFELKRQGYQTVSLADLYAFLRGEKQLPDKSFVLTFDDGAKSSYYNVDPILEALNYTAVMFVITGGSIENSKSPYYLNSIELSHLQKTGRWEIESHTHKSHFRLPIGQNGEIGAALTNKLWLQNESRLETDEEYFLRVSNDLETADNLLESNFNKEITSFALPFGDFGERGSNYPYAHEILQNLTFERYKLVFSQFTTKTIYRANYDDELKNSYLVVRLSVDGLRTPEELLEEIEASRAIELPYFEDYSNNDKWPIASGESSFTKDSIILQTDSNADDTIILAYLDGSYLLRNYIYDIELKDEGASEITLISRFKDAENYVGCRYNGNVVSIISVKDAISSHVKDVTLAQTEPLINGTKLSMSVYGTNVNCLSNGKLIVNDVVSDVPPYGGVGLRAEGFGRDRDFAFGNILIR